jgi:hypothetical protein
MAFRPHLADELQPVDVSWARSFKAKFVELSGCVILGSEAMLIGRLHPAGCACRPGSGLPSSRGGCLLLRAGTAGAMAAGANGGCHNPGRRR